MDLPLTTGPIFLLLTIEHGARFHGGAAVGINRLHSGRIGRDTACEMRRAIGTSVLVEELANSGATGLNQR
jgi:hypothetical protein